MGTRWARPDHSVERPRFAAYAAGQAACVGHVAEHDLGAAAYAIKAAQSAQPDNPQAGALERDWQRAQLPDQIRALVLEDQARRNSICWSVFFDAEWPASPASPTARTRRPAPHPR